MGEVGGWVGGGAAATIVYGVIQIVKMLLDKRKGDAAAVGLEVDGASRLSQQTLDAMARLTDFYEARIKAIQLDASNQIASARADAAQAVAAALNQVSGARGEANEARRACEAVEGRLRQVSLEAWRPDFSIERLRALLSGGDGGASVNGSPTLVPR
jgi:hypothetical protein